MPSKNDSNDSAETPIRQSEQYGELIREFAPPVGSLSASTWELKPQSLFTQGIISCEFHHRDSKARIRFENTDGFRDGATDVSIFAELPDESEVKQNPDDVDDQLVYATEFPMLEWAVWFAEFFARNIDRYNNEP